jgi:hypothetical protein
MGTSSDRGASGWEARLKWWSIRRVDKWYRRATFFVKMLEDGDLHNLSFPDAKQIGRKK